MAAESRTPDTPLDLDPVKAVLEREPWLFEAFHAITVLERLYPERAEVGKWAKPADEVVHFSAHPSLAFPPSQIHELDLPDEEGKPARMVVNFMGVIGPQGVLPLHYTELVGRLSRAGRHSVRDFLDLFQHRMVSLFYQAWRKHRFTVAFNRDDRLADHVLDLVGAGQESVRGRLPFDDRALVFYAGLLASKARSATALEALVEDYFGVEAEVIQFQGGWYPLSDDDVCRLDEGGIGTQLGLGAVTGDEIWDPQARVRIRIGPLPREMFVDFLPGGEAHAALSALAEFFSRGEYDLDVQLVLERAQVPGCVLGADDQPLGWSTWVRTSEFDRDPDETIFRL